MTELQKDCMSLNRAMLPGFGLLILAGFLQAAPAQAQQEDIAGEWRGFYRCGQGETALTVTIEPDGEGLFEFGPHPGNPNIPAGSYHLEIVRDDGQVRLQAGSWIDQPPGYITVSADGQIAPDGATIEGRIDYSNCGEFRIERDAPEVMAEAGIAAPSAAMRPPARPPAAMSADGDAGPPPTTQAPAQDVGSLVPDAVAADWAPLRDPYAGVWTGTFECSASSAPTALSLTLERSGNREWSGTMEQAAAPDDPNLGDGTFEVTGQFLYGPELSISAGTWIDRRRNGDRPRLDLKLARDFNTLSGESHLPACRYSLERDPPWPLRPADPEPAPAAIVAATPSPPEPAGLALLSPQDLEAYETATSRIDLPTRPEADRGVRLVSETRQPYPGVRLYMLGTSCNSILSLEIDSPYVLATMDQHPWGRLFGVWVAGCSTGSGTLTAPVYSLGQQLGTAFVTVRDNGGTPDVTVVMDPGAVEPPPVDGDQAFVLKAIDAFWRDGYGQPVDYDPRTLNALASRSPDLAMLAYRLVGQRWSRGTKPDALLVLAASLGSEEASFELAEALQYGHIDGLTWGEPSTEAVDQAAGEDSQARLAMCMLVRADAGSDGRARQGLETLGEGSGEMARLAAWVRRNGGVRADCDGYQADGTLQPDETVTENAAVSEPVAATLPDLAPPVSIVGTWGGGYDCQAPDASARIEMEIVDAGVGQWGAAVTIEPQGDVTRFGGGLFSAQVIYEDGVFALRPIAWLKPSQPGEPVAMDLEASADGTELSGSGPDAGCAYSLRKVDTAVSVPSQGTASIDVEAPSEGQLEDLILSGRTFRFSNVSQSFAAGFATALVDKCSLSISGEERLTLFQFIQLGMTSSLMGTEYNNPDLLATLGSQQAMTGSFGAGALAADQLECVEPLASEAAKTIVRLIEANRGEGAAEGQVFIDSCQQQFSAAQCSCLAGIGVSVYPDIYSRPYDRTIIDDIIQANPLVGLTIGLQCGISNY